MGETELAILLNRFSMYVRDALIWDNALAVDIDFLIIHSSLGALMHDAFTLEAPGHDLSGKMPMTLIHPFTHYVILFKQ